jgi:hypothetical protein
MLRLRRIYWRSTATPDARRACAEWLRGRGLMPISIVAPKWRQASHAWIIKRADP